MAQGAIEWCAAFRDDIAEPCEGTGRQGVENYNVSRTFLVSAFAVFENGEFVSL